MDWRARLSARKNPESKPGLTYQTQEGGGHVAKDGTNRGGRRVRAGAKPDPLKDRLETGKPASRLLHKTVISEKCALRRGRFVGLNSVLSVLHATMAWREFVECPNTSLYRSSRREIAGRGAAW